MYYTSLDAITRSYLAQRSLSVHYYIRTLKLVADGYRELHYDVLQVVNVRKLDVTDWKAAILPEDFVDVVQVSVRNGDNLIPLTQGKYHRLHNFNDEGDFIPWEVGDTGSTDVPRETLLNENHQFTGRIYGGVKDYGDYIVVPERGEIQLAANSDFSEIILEYLGDINYTNAATKVHGYAQAALEAYAAWKSDRDQADVKDAPKARTYINEVRKLKGRLNSLTADDIKRLIRNGSKATIKG